MSYSVLFPMERLHSARRFPG